MTQMDLFESQNISNLRQEIDKINKSTASVRRGLFARNTALEKYMIELQDQIERLEREIYRLKQKVYNQEPDIHEVEKVM